MDCDQILPNFFVGSFPSTADDMETLKECGITAVLNLQSDDDFQTHRIDWPTLQAQYASLGIVTRRVPIIDFDDDDLRAKLPVAVQALAELRAKEHTVFLHCNAGVNRSPSVAICYLHWIEGWSLDEAIDHVCRCHPSAPVMDVIRLATWDWRRGMG